MSDELGKQLEALRRDFSSYHETATRRITELTAERDAALADKRRLEERFAFVENQIMEIAKGLRADWSGFDGRHLLVQIKSVFEKAALAPADQPGEVITEIDNTRGHVVVTIPVESRDQPPAERKVCRWKLTEPKGWCVYETDCKRDIRSIVKPTGNCDCGLPIEIEEDK